MTLDAAIAAADWPRALGLALDAWRSTRAPVYADLVDRIAHRAPREIVPVRGAQRWWMQRARSYDPIIAGPLLEDAARLAPRGGIEHKLFERLELLAAWPDDPRTAGVLATWFVETNIGWMYAHADRTRAFFEAVAAVVVKLRDTRVLPQLAAAVAEPRGKTVGLRELQQRLAQHAIEALTSTAPAVIADAAAIARWVPAPATAPATLDERALWIAAAEGMEARLVLADFLLEGGDPRGEIITLACAGDAANLQRSNALLHQQWERWMGELALVLDRGFCTFTDGVLDVATIGIAGAPPWVYPKVAAHRELATIRAVRCGWHVPDADYVAFLDALPRLPSRVRVYATALEKLALARASWPVQTLELVMNVHDLGEPVSSAVTRAASVLPGVEAIEIPLTGELDGSVIDAVRVMPQLFPRLARIAIDATRHLSHDLRDALVALAEELPCLEVEHGFYAR